MYVYINLKTFRLTLNSAIDDEQKWGRRFRSAATPLAIDDDNKPFEVRICKRCIDFEVQMNDITDHKIR